MFRHDNWLSSESSDLSRVEALMRDLLELQPGPAAKGAIEHLAVGGKRIRARLAVDAARNLRLGSQSAVAIGAASELLHNASLIHDDIQDGSELRRGATTVWAKYGRNVAICAGDLMISGAFAALGSAQNKYFTEALTCMHLRISEAIRGQTEDLFYKPANNQLTGTYERTDQTIEKFCQIASGKSASLISLPIELALIMSGRIDQTSSAKKAATAFAIAYQAADDIEDIKEDKEIGRPNLVAMLETHCTNARALLIARSIAVDYYALASKISIELPENSGNMLSNLASNCAKNLK